MRNRLRFSLIGLTVAPFLMHAAQVSSIQMDHATLTLRPSDNAAVSVSGDKLISSDLMQRVKGNAEIDITCTQACHIRIHTPEAELHTLPLVAQDRQQTPEPGQQHGG